MKGIQGSVKKLIVLIAICGYGVGCSQANPNNTVAFNESFENTYSDEGFILIPFESTIEEVKFSSSDGTRLVGQLDIPVGVSNPPLVFIIHHSGPVDRDSYQYLAALLVPKGFAVFRFDKRGNGQSKGTYGCCEAEDALAAYRAATSVEVMPDTDVFIVAQSIGTRILAQHFTQFDEIYPVQGTVLLSSILEGKEIEAITSPVFIIVSDQETNLNAITSEAVEAYRSQNGKEANYYIVSHTEHTLFDISRGPIDWKNPNWPLRFSNDVAAQLIDWLESHRP